MIKAEDIKSGDIIEREIYTQMYEINRSYFKVKKQQYDGIFTVENLDDGSESTMNIAKEQDDFRVELFKCIEQLPDEFIMRGLVGKTVRLKDKSQYLVLGYKTRFGRPYIITASDSDNFNLKLAFMSAEDLLEKTNIRQYVRVNNYKLI